MSLFDFCNSMKVLEALPASEPIKVDVQAEKQGLDAFTRAAQESETGYVTDAAWKAKLYERCVPPNPDPKKQTITGGNGTSAQRKD